jgi:hypothetical protein
MDGFADNVIIQETISSTVAQNDHNLARTQRAWLSSDRTGIHPQFAHSAAPGGENEKLKVS